MTSNAPFRILAIADFSGRTSRNAQQSLETRATHRVDPDTLHTLPASLGTAVRLPSRGDTELRIDSLDDLHPDAFSRTCPVFAALAELRAEADTPDQAERAADRLRGWAEEHTRPASQIEPKPAATATPESEYAAIHTPGNASPDTPPQALRISNQGPVSRLKHLFARRIADPAAVRPESLPALIDAAAHDEKRSILRDRDWRRAESAWRSLPPLAELTRGPVSPELHILDATNDELGNQPDALASILLRPSADHRPAFPLILHLEQHTPTTLDTLAPIADIAHRAGSVAASGITPHTVGLDRFDTSTPTADWDQPCDAYSALAASPAAACLCLACPGLLLRPPYTAASADEQTAGPTTRDSLWSSGALAVGLVLARAFASIGWDLRPTGGGTIDGLPAHSGTPLGATEHTEHQFTEAPVDQRTASALAARGLSPILNTDKPGAAHLMGLRALNTGSLACGWA